MKYSVVEYKFADTKKWRAKHKMGLRKFAKLCGLDYTHLFRLEDEQYIATEKTARKILKAMWQHEEKPRN